MGKHKRHGEGMADVHRLDHRFGLGALLGKARAAATCRCSSSTTSSRGKLFLHGLRKTLCRWRALLQFVWRRIARHAALNAPVLAAAFVGLGANSLCKYPKRCWRPSHDITRVTRVTLVPFCRSTPGHQIKRSPV